jgi:spore germination protein YaaH
MIKWIFFACVLIGITTFGVLRFGSINETNETVLMEGEDSTDNERELKNKGEPPSLAPERTPISELQSRSVFVPYWADMSSRSDDVYDRYIYFGITVDENGVDREDTGYAQLDRFQAFTRADSENLLAIRMIDRERNADILSNQESWDDIVTDVQSVVKEYGFDGVVLDLEVGLMAFGDYTANITPFTEELYTTMSADGTYVAFSLYGDVFFRKRPYDIEQLNPYVDEFMIMAYDFSKSFGNPGPNFPFEDVQNEYRYDFQQMINDYLTFVEPERLSVIFGMYGYHWVVDDQGRALKQAEAISLHEIKQQYITSCPVEECVRKQEEYSQESVITFEDDEGYKNIIWHENEASSQAKTDYLLEQGIGDIVYWAWGYY